MDTFPTGRILLSYFYDRINPLPVDERNKLLSISSIADLAKDVCAGPTTWEKRWGSDKTVMEELEGRPVWCLDLTFMYTLLRLGYEFGDNRQAKLRKRIDGTELGGEKTWKHADSTASKLLDSFFTFLPVTPRSLGGSIPWFWVAIYPVFTDSLRVRVRVSVQSLVKSVNTAEHTSTNYKSGLLMNP